ncbi:hypothetical protein Droror1_Dr00026951 [Drosera rotundifolia]
MDGKFHTGFLSLESSSPTPFTAKPQAAASPPHCLSRRRCWLFSLLSYAYSCAVFLFDFARRPSSSQTNTKPCAFFPLSPPPCFLQPDELQQREGRKDGGRAAVFSQGRFGFSLFVTNHNGPHGPSSKVTGQADSGTHGLSSAQQ